MALSKTQHETAVRAMKSDPATGRRKLRKLLGCSDWAAHRFLKSEAWKKGPGPAATERTGVSVTDFAKRFDFESMLRDTIRQNCSDRFVADADIRLLSGVPVGSYRALAALPEFTACQIRDGGTIWWSARKNVEHVRAKARKWGISK